MEEEDTAALQRYFFSQPLFILRLLLPKVCYIWLHVDPILGLAETAVTAKYISLLLIFYIKANTSI